MDELSGVEELSGSEELSGVDELSGAEELSGSDELSGSEELAGGVVSLLDDVSPSSSISIAPPSGSEDSTAKALIAIR